MEITNKEIASYTESFTSEEPEIIRELIKASEDNLEFTNMLSGKQVGLLLKMLVKVSGARRILEVGTFTGYSAIMMADAMPDDGLLITCEMNRMYEDISRPFFGREPYKRKIRQILGNALDIIPRLEGPFDLVFLDADKINYPNYYKMVREKVRPGGLIILDNMLWGGGVIEGEDSEDSKATAIHKTSEMIRDDGGVEQLLLPLRDGLTIVLVND
ncbi:MAG: class I SAM-dependent methyltransferase [Balneolaceae bacterium]|nr:class I SAM-dependent methyltransferase [Balneolaceae bacterium]MCH8549927.1 class I SAM-dependent methyltransferase [Balneolaceae bacterium]